MCTDFEVARNVATPNSVPFMDDSKEGFDKALGDKFAMTMDRIEAKIGLPPSMQGDLISLCYIAIRKINADWVRNAFP